LCVVSGPFDAVEAAEQRLAASAIPFKRLATSHAFHSPMMEPVLRPLGECLRRVTLRAPKLPWVSNVTGKWITPEQATSVDYWLAHLRQTVRFADGIAELVKVGHGILLEVGPGQTLAGLARQHPATSASAARIVATLGRAADSALTTMLNALGELWVTGITPDWRKGFYRHERRRIVALPTYPFERKRYWIEPGIRFELAAETSSVAESPRATHSADIAGPADGAATVSAADPNGARQADDRSTLATLKGVFQELSGIDLADAGADQSFYELGFDSLFLTQASLAVAKHFGVEVTFRQLREELVTFAKLATFVDAHKTASAPPPPEPETDNVAPTPGRKRVPLTDAQREMWFASQMGMAVSSAYNEESTLRLSGALDVDALHHALQQLVARHEALRTTFASAGDVQIISAARTMELPLDDFSAAPDRELGATACLHEEVERPFDLVNGPLFRARLVRLEPRFHLLVLVVHHIVCDGWSLGTLVRELGELYAAETSGRDAKLPEPLRFSDYAERTAARDTPEFKAAEAYWKAQFADSVPVLELPTDRPRPAERTYAGAFLLRSLSPEITAEARRLSSERGCTLFTTLLATFNVLLHRLSGQDDLVVGVPSASQVMNGLGNLVGHFANLLPVRSRISDTATFAAYLAQVQRQMTDAVDHWQFPFTEMVRQLKLARDASRVPLANVVFNSSRLRGSLQFGVLDVEAIVSPKRFVNFDLNFNFAVHGDTLSLGCYYSTELFDEATVARWVGHFETLLRTAAANPNLAVAELSLLTEAEKQRMIVEWNATAAAYPREQCVHELFAEHARRDPRATALVQGNESLSYGELEWRSMILAEQLRERGVGPDVPVGISAERSFDMIVAVLAVLKAGGACVPLDPAYPPERLAFMLEASRAPVVLTQRSLVPTLPVNQAAVICVDELPVGGALRPDDSRSKTNAAGHTPPAADSLAYVLYTSGSTGEPKGVAMPHRALTNLIHWQGRDSRVGQGGRTLQYASLSFDVSFQEIFSTLGAGGTLVLVDQATRRDARALWRVIARERVERLFLPFVGLQQLAEAFRPGEDAVELKEIITAGEPLQITPKIAALFDALPECTLHNHYGPTETHVVTALTLSGPPQRWPARPAIGRPIANTRIYLLDDAREPVPIGVLGELYIGGDCLARGYLHGDDLTREKFVSDPFTSGNLLYRTGDLARYRVDGTIEFVGRIDHQVKLNGYRIELGEIESVLGKHAGVGECAVVLRGDQPTQRRLVAYVVPAAGQAAPPAGELRQLLQARLPDYMVPSGFVTLEKLPLTPSGKVDRRALPAPEVDGEADADDAPRTLAEEVLAQIWTQVLGVKRVGVQANFFELGGHSLLATQVISRVHEALGIELPLARFFAAPTIAALAPVIEEVLVEDIKTTCDEETMAAAAEPIGAAKG
jgi:amino acid adenylation domain-containing protein